MNLIFATKIFWKVMFKIGKLWNGFLKVFKRFLRQKKSQESIFASWTSLIYRWSQTSNSVCCRIKLFSSFASWPISKESFHTLQTAKSHGNKIIPKYKLTLNYHSWNNVEWYFLCDFQTLWLFFIFFWDQRNPKMRFCLDSLSKK